MFVRIKVVVVILLLVVGILYQGWNVLFQAGQDLISIWKAMGQHAIWRSANFAVSQNFANYILFLNENIPKTGRVVLPPKGIGLKMLSHTPFMQFFLSPREVLNCTDITSDCATKLSHSGAYVLVVDDYPGINTIEQPERLHMFSEGWGILFPGGEINNSTSKIKPFSSLREIVKAMIWPGLWIMSLVGGGFILINSIFPSLWISSKLSLGYGLSLGWLSLGLYVTSLFGYSFSRGTVIAVTILWWFFVLFVHLYPVRYVRERYRESQEIIETSHMMDKWHVVFLILGIVGIALAVGKGYHTTDAIVLWGAKGYGIAAKGLSSGVSYWGTKTTKYPLHIPLTIAAFKILFSDLLPESKIIFPIYYLGLLFVVYDFLREKVHSDIAGLFTLAYATTPIVFQHGVIGYANLPLTYYIVTSVILIECGFNEKSRQMRIKWLALGSLFFVFSSWTRPEGLIMSGLLISMITAVGLTKWSRYVRLPMILSLATPYIVFAVVWFLSSSEIYTNSVGTEGLLSYVTSQFPKGNFHFPEIGYILQNFVNQVLNVNVWGIVGFAIIILMLMSYRNWNISQSFSIIIGAGLICVILILSIYYVTSYEKVHDIGWWLNTGLNRMMLPGITLLWVGMINLFSVGLENYK